MPIVSHISNLETDMKSALRAFFPKEVVRTVDSHEGDFGPNEIENYAKAANALVLACAGGSSELRGGLVNATQIYDLFVICKGNTIRDRTLGSRVIMEYCLKLLHRHTTWATDECVGIPRAVQNKNLYGPKIDEMGLSLWVIRWSQDVQIPYDEELQNLADFATLWASYLRVGETDPNNTIGEQEITLETV